MRTINDICDDLEYVAETLPLFTDADGGARISFHAWEGLTDDAAEYRAELWAALQAGAQ